MPIIPQRKSTQNMITTSPTVRRSTDVESIGGRITQAIGSTLEDVASRFEKAQSLNEVTRADTDATIKLRDLQQEAANDSDVWNIKKYQNRINEIKEEAGKNISIPSARDEFQFKFDADAAVADFNIRKTMRKRQVDSMRADMVENLDALRDQYVGAGSDVEQKMLRTKRANLIDNYVIAGAIDKEAAANLKIKLKDEWEEASVRVAIDADATLAKEMLEAGDFDLSADDKAHWLEAAEKKIKNNKKVAEDNVQQIWSTNLGNVLANLNDTSVSELIKIVSDGEIDPAEANKLVRWKTDKDRSKPFGQYETDKQIWMDLIEDGLASEQNLHKFLKRINTAVSKEQINAEEAAEFAIQAQNLFKTAINNKSNPSTLGRLIVSVIKKFKQFNTFTLGKEGLDVAYQMTKDLIKRVNDGQVTEENVEQQGQAILESATKIVNPNRAMYKIGDIVNTPAGPAKVGGFDADGEPMMEMVE